MNSKQNSKYKIQNTLRYILISSELVLVVVINVVRQRWYQWAWVWVWHNGYGFECVVWVLVWVWVWVKCGCRRSITQNRSHEIDHEKKSCIKPKNIYMLKSV